MKPERPKTDALRQQADECLFGNYGRRELALDVGKGARVWDVDGREYLDFLAGIAVCALGHGHEAVTSAIALQANQMMHCSNLYLIPQQIALGRLLTEHCDLKRAFFCNSGTEANEAAIKLARRHAYDSVRPNHTDVICFRGGFHGRTMGSLSATAQPKYHAGFAPLVPGFRYVDFNDLDAVAQEFKTARHTANQPDAYVCAVIVEPIQSEGGVNLPLPGFLEGLKDLCWKNNALLIFDEVQTAMGRLGTLFGYQHFGVVPDIITMAKALGGGFPIGAMLSQPKIAKRFVPGTHAATFGGNPLACAAARATLETIINDGLCDHAKRMGDYLLAKLRGLPQSYQQFIHEIRGVGLMVGIELGSAWPLASQIVAECANHGLIVGSVGDRVVRMLPPLIITRTDVDEAVEKFSHALHEVGQAHAHL